MLESRIHGRGGQGAQVVTCPCVRHLDETAIREIQDDTDRRWEALTGRGS